MENFKRILWKTYSSPLKFKNAVFLTHIIVFGVLFGILISWFGQIIEATIPVNVTLSVSDDPLLTKNGSSKQANTYKVPNIVHFIWFGTNKEMKFLNYISILSVHKIHKPELIMFHCNHLPVGPWWEKLWHQVPLEIHFLEPPGYIHGQKISHVYHQGDVAKIEILMQYGGIYLDCDVVVVNPMHELRVHDVTLGKEKHDKFIAGIIIARPNAPFLKLWYESYRNNYRPHDWDYNCARVTYQIYLKRPDLMHVEPYRLTTPDADDWHQLWWFVIEWRHLFCVHVMQHLIWKDYNPENIKQLESTFGETVRYIYYGSADKVL